ncbi:MULTISPECIES: OmpP1/FadL family transporter [unclassified Lentimonas]|uniref:OmpP1/FadL family transporter n=1 Tax=unclassified Lentimonas TaxID=2630993 RepID=UPI001325CC81|nr:MULTISPECIES: outer membrane protein transport protein [unclassified Lentimonas]CAA6676675.1 Unannotated [Lentimonas sp. CC4]CAA6684661.1 Unannotated [Lentimonas sp. CC6]CAA6694154.1 Unannotated [Lentimonas sp. CC19]CAA6694350.1 Unannotated [Lentimonas sp. CC10]CAA7070371.1 Unannotated [Lentimonas sp. CC11]
MNHSTALKLTAFFTLTSVSIHGAAFYLSEVGTPGSLGTGGVVNPVNNKMADSAWANPAGMTGLDSDEMLLGSQVIVPIRKFDSSSASTAGGGDGGDAGVPAAIPSFFAVKQYNENLSLGFSIVGAMGGGDDFGDNWVGRYGATEVSLQGLSISPAVGYQVTEDLSIGAGVSIINTQFYQKLAIKSPLPLGSDGSAEFDDMEDWGTQPFFGLTYQINEKTLFGLVYRAEMDVELEGDLKIKNAGPLDGKSDLDLDWDNPQWIEAGISYELTDEWVAAFNLGWQEWSTFSDNHVTISNGAPVTLDRNWKDTWHGGVAFTRFMEDSAFSFGFSYESSPVDDDDRTIDFAVDEQYKFSAAYAWNQNQNWKCSVGATVIFSGDAEVDQVAQGERIKGEFETNMLVIAGFTAQRRF